MQRHGLLRLLKRPIAIGALLMLLIAQSAASFHAASHLRDSAGVPGSHTQLCLACASFAPLASAHGGIVTSFTVAALAIAEFVRSHDDAAVGHRPLVPFRSRAPPR